MRFGAMRWRLLRELVRPAPSARWGDRLLVPSRAQTLLIWVVAAIAAAIALAIVIHTDLWWPWADGRSRVTIARSVIDNQQPGFAQFGGVWLPLHPAAILLTVWIDPLYHSGAAGVIVSMISYAATAYFTHRFVYVLTGSRAGAFVGAAAILLALNFALLAATPMSEPFFAAVYMGGWYYLLRWSKSDGDADLALAGLFVGASTMIRYDGWMSLPAGALFVLLARFSHLRHNPVRVEAGIVAFAALAAFPIFLWLYYRWQVFGSPLGFAFGDLSAAAAAAQRTAQTGFTVKGDLLGSIRLFAWTAFDNIGLLYSIASVVGLAVGAIFLKGSKARLALLLPATAIVFNIVSLYIGGSEILNQHVTPELGLLNSRYGLIAVTFASVMIGVIASFGIIPTLLASAVVLGQVGLFVVQPQPLVNVRDVMQGTPREYQQVAAAFDDAYDHGLVMISFLDFAQMMPATDVPLHIFIHEGVNVHHPSFRDAVQNPPRYVRFIVYRVGGAGDLSKLLSTTAIEADYDLVAKIGNNRIYKIKPSTEERERAAGLTPP